MTKEKGGRMGQKAHRAKVLGHILGTLRTQARRGYLAEDDTQLCRACGTEHETDSHVMWDCKHISLVRKRREVAEAVRLEWRKAGLSGKALATANALWRLTPDGGVDMGTEEQLQGAIDAEEDPETLESLERLHHALARHTLDPTGLYLDRAGVFGEGWVRLVEQLGLPRPQAIETLAAVSAVLQGQKAGTRLIWQAFTAELDGRAGKFHTREDKDHRLERDESWEQLQHYRQVLEKAHITQGRLPENDDTNAIFNKMEAPTMTNEDRNVFLEHLGCWTLAVEYDLPTE
jgi:hypothetical protein